jgi:mRNA interferase MazF
MNQKKNGTRLVYTVNKSDLIEKIGQVSENRVYEILEGLNLLTEPREI